VSNNPPCGSCDLDRRRWLTAAAKSAGLVVLGSATLGCGNDKGSPPTGPVSGGNISALPVGTLRVLSNVAVARDAGGVYGMSAVCTHAGCLVGSSGTIAAGLSCPCHGSLFDGDGAVTRGPASLDLQNYAVTIASDGAITVDGSMPVSAGTRTPVA
jgi:Rieske Fe-S protein